MEITIHHMLEDVILQTLEDENLPFREALTEIFFYILEGAHSNPGITTAHLYSLVVEKHYQSVSGPLSRIHLSDIEALHSRLSGCQPETTLVDPV